MPTPPPPRLHPPQQPVPPLPLLPPLSNHPAAEKAQARRASVAVGLAPLGVLLGFTAVVGGWVEPDIGLAVFATCTTWLVYEMYRYQQVVDTLGDGVNRP